MAVIQQDGSAVAAIVDFASMANHAAVAARQFIGHVAQKEPVFGEDFIFDNVDIEWHTSPTAWNDDSILRCEARFVVSEAESI